MADGSGIEWTDATWNPIRARNLATGGIGHFCVHASEGCRFCYAERMQRRFRNPIRYAAQDRGKVDLFFDEAELLRPLRWRRPRTIFPCSMTDLFGEFVPTPWIDQMLAVMALSPQHSFQIVTKRAARMRAYMTTSDRKRTIAATVIGISERLARAARTHKAKIKLDHFSACFAGSGPFPNVWLGISAEDQARADERIPELLATPAAVRFVSAEPLLGPVDLRGLPSPCRAANTNCCGGNSRVEATRGYAFCERAGADPAPKLDWVIVGGESGPGARPMHTEWARSLRDQCASAGVPFFFKQWGEHRPCTAAELTTACGAILVGDRHDRGSYMLRVGKKAAGRLLDGVEHDGMPALPRAQVAA